MKNISSSMTIIFKFFIPIGYVIGVSYHIFYLMIFLEEYTYAPLILIYIFALFFILFHFIRLKIVSMDEKYLYISNFFKDEKIHRKEIEAVGENKFLNYNLIKIYFTEKTIFGKSIIFMPTFWVTFFSSHPIVKELLKDVDDT